MKYLIALTTAAVMIGTLLLSASAFAGEVLVDSRGVAIRGYDPVAYFTMGAAKRGKKNFSSEYGGATYRFVSPDHKTLFDMDPAKYVPAYGGYCAYGVAQGVKVKIQPDKFKIVDGKLYLNFNGSVQKTWEKDIPGYIKTADMNWPKLDSTN